MKSGQRIPTPLKHRWRRFRYGALPGICFGACIVLTLVLWRGQGRLPNAVGEVESLSVPITASVGGRIEPRVPKEFADLPGANEAAWWKRFERVTKGTRIARIDGSVIHTELITFRAELDRIKLEGLAAKEQLRVDMVRMNDTANVSRAVLAYVAEFERARLEVLDRETAIASDTIALQRLNTQLNYLEGLAAKDVAVQMQLDEIRLTRDETDRRIAGNRDAIREARDQEQRARDRYEKLTRELADEIAAPLDLDVIVKPLEEEVRVQEVRIDALKRQIELLDIIAPFDGTISEVYLYPGQHVQPGDPILMLTRDDGKREQHIVSYLRQSQRIRPKEGATVQLRARMPGSPAVPAKIKKVGPRFEPVPISQLSDPARPETGLPVQILIPDELKSDLRPGELIDVRFQR